AMPSAMAVRSPAPAPTATGCSADTTRCSWQWRLPGNDRELGEQRQQTESEGPAIELAIANHRGRVDRRAFHLIDVGVNVLQRGSVTGAEVPSAGHAGNVAQQIFVDFDRLVLVAQSAGGVPSHRHRRHADAAHTDT